MRRSEVFLKRESDEIGINFYNLEILNSVESNMDSKTVLNESGLANYILNYVTKPETGTSKLVREAVKERTSSLKEIFFEQYQQVQQLQLNISTTDCLSDYGHVINAIVSESTLHQYQTDQ